jgi:hypothetical protein
MPQTEARTRSPKTATVERREASVPSAQGARRASQARQQRQCACRRSAHPSRRRGRRIRTRTRTRRGNVMGYLTSEDVSCGECGRGARQTNEALDRPHAEEHRRQRARVGLRFERAAMRLEACGRGTGRTALRDARTRVQCVNSDLLRALLRMRAEQQLSMRAALDRAPITGAASARSCPRSSPPRRGRRDSSLRGCRSAR